MFLFIERTFRCTRAHFILFIYLLLAWYWYFILWMKFFLQQYKINRIFFWLMFHAHAKSWMENVFIWPLKQQSDTTFFFLFSSLNWKLEWKIVCIKILCMCFHSTQRTQGIQYAYYTVHSARRWFLPPSNPPSALIGSSVSQVFPSIENRSFIFECNIWFRFQLCLNRWIVLTLVQ